ncbi:MAG: MCE family protein [Leptospira sp.]|jgi:ABC-type transporter Mla subunit MlaD|nr:MCE family protein [Leptospira sp.]NCS94234.1 MCE family protein [Leptospira sp.]
MKQGSNYFKVGIFVLAAISIFVTFVIILGVGSIFRKNVYMESYLDESVQGLDVGSAVKHRGVKIGSVDEISFIQNEYALNEDNDGQNNAYQYGRYVYIKMSIPGIVKALPLTQIDQAIKQMIKQGLRVRLSSQGLTGTAYLEVDYLSPDKNPPLPITWQPKYHYIPSAPSTISRLSASLDTFFDKLESTDIRGLILNLNTLILTVNSEVEKAKLGELTSEGTVLIAELRKTNRELNAILATPEMKNAPKKLDQALSQLNTTTKRLDTILSSNQNDIGVAVENLRTASQDLKEVTGNAKKYPSMILFGEPPAKSQIWK